MKRSPELSSCSSSSNVGFESPKRRRKRTTTSRSQMKPRKNRSNQKQTTTGNSRSSIYRGVTRHRLTGRFEAHLWDKSSWNSVQTKKGRQVYLGAYDVEETAARTYDLAALKYWGKDAILNFPIETYTKEIEEMDKFSREEFLASLRRHSNGFSRGVSKYRGVARHHHNGRWEARIGRVNGSKYIYLGTFETQEEAAEAYDKAALEYRGLNAVTNFDKRKYKDQITKKIDQSQETETFQKRKKSKQSQITATKTETVHTNSESNQVVQVLLTTKTTTTTPPPSEITQQRDQLLVQCNSNSISAPLSMESNSVVDNNILDKDLPWSFMDAALPQFQSPELASSKAEDLLSMFYNADFDADIEFLFGSEPIESDFNLSAILDSFESEDNVVIGNAAGRKVVDDDNHDDNKQKQKQQSSSSKASYSFSKSPQKYLSPSSELAP